MVNLLIGPKGSGKTQILMDKANNVVENCSGNIVFIKKSHDDTYSLSFNIRVACMDDYPEIAGIDSYTGFLLGMLSTNHDINNIFIDGLLKHSGINECDMPKFIEELKKISREYNVDFYVSLSAKKDMIETLNTDGCTLLN